MLKKVRVWDLPTRLFHWSLATCVLGLVITANVGGNAMVWHFRLGYGVLSLVLFRLVWGMVGGHWSRFSTFLPTSSTLIQYVKSTKDTGQSVGHNPLGALSVAALLFFCFAQAAAGLMSDDEIAAAGPLVSKIPAAWVSIATFVHTEVTKVVLIALVFLHIAAILWYRLKKGENLITPMLVGDKLLPETTTASCDSFASRALAGIVFVLCVGAVNVMLRWAA
jgi:cytochrome b